MICVTCGEPTTDIVKNKCRGCYNKYMRDYMRDRYAKRRVELIQLLGGHCIDCGSFEELQFDHADAVSKSFDIGKRLDSAPWKMILEEADKCVLRCKACHDHKSKVFRDDRSVDHGGGLTGKRNCYCDRCAPLKREYNRNFKLGLLDTGPDELVD